MSNVGGVNNSGNDGLRAVANAKASVANAEAAMLEKIGKNSSAEATGRAGGATQAPAAQAGATPASTPQAPQVSEEAVTVKLTNPDGSEETTQLTAQGKWITPKPATPQPAVPQNVVTNLKPETANELLEALTEQTRAPGSEQPLQGKTVAPPPNGAGGGLPASGLGSAHAPGVKGAPAGPVTTGTTAPGQQAPIESRVPTTQVPSQMSAQSAFGTPESTQDDQMVQILTLLKSQNVVFKDAVKVLSTVQTGRKQPSEAVLKALWNTIETDTPEAKTKAAELPILKRPLDEVIRDPGWTRSVQAQAAAAARVTVQSSAAEGGRPGLVDTIGANAQSAGGAQAASAPGTSAQSAAQAFARAADPDVQAQVTLQTSVVNNPVNQVYIAGLSTAEFSRLVAMLGANAPVWWWELRNHRGLRRLMESRTFAGLNSRRVLGVRPLFWMLAFAGVVTFFLVGQAYGVWW